MLEPASCPAVGQADEDEGGPGRVSKRARDYYDGKLAEKDAEITQLKSGSSSSSAGDTGVTEKVLTKNLKRCSGADLKAIHKALTGGDPPGSTKAAIIVSIIAKLAV